MLDDGHTNGLSVGLTFHSNNIEMLDGGGRRVREQGTREKFDLNFKCRGLESSGFEETMRPVVLGSITPSHLNYLLSSELAGPMLLLMARMARSRNVNDVANASKNNVSNVSYKVMNLQLRHDSSRNEWFHEG